MFKRIKLWLADRAEARRLRRYYQGYRWAMTELTSCRMTPQQVADKIDYVYDRTEFERGATRALYNYELAIIDLKQVEEPHDPDRK